MIVIFKKICYFLLGGDGMNRFSDNLKRLRKEKGYTQQELATLVNVSQGTIHFWENGRNFPNTLKIVNLLTIFQCSALDLMGDDIGIIPPKAAAALDQATNNMDMSIFLRDSIKKFQSDIIESERNDLEKELLGAFNELTEEGQQKVVDYATDLTTIPKYKK